MSPYKPPTPFSWNSPKMALGAWNSQRLRDNKCADHHQGCQSVKITSPPSQRRVPTLANHDAEGQHRESEGKWHEETPGRIRVVHAGIACPPRQYATGTHTRPLTRGAAGSNRADRQRASGGDRGGLSTILAISSRLKTQGSFLACSSGICRIGSATSVAAVSVCVS